MRVSDVAPSLQNFRQALRAPRPAVTPTVGFFAPGCWGKHRSDYSHQRTAALDNSRVDRSDGPESRTGGGNAGGRGPVVSGFPSWISGFERGPVAALRGNERLLAAVVF